VGGVGGDISGLRVVSGLRMGHDETVSGQDGGALWARVVTWRACRFRLP